MLVDSLTWVTPGVGSAISGISTALGAITAVWIAQRYFSGKVRDLKTALAEAENAVESFRASAFEKFAALDEAFATLNAATSALQLSASNTQAAVYEAQESVDEVAHDEVPRADNHREEVKEYWSEASRHLEEIASSENVDGRTRAKYGRIDRRSYYDLIDALDVDGRLAGLVAQTRRAAEIWYSCRRANSVDDQIASEMRALRDLILSIPLP